MNTSNNKNEVLYELELLIKQEFDNMMLNRRLDTASSWINWIVKGALLTLATWQGVIFSSSNQTPPTWIIIILVCLSALNIILPLIVNDRRFIQRQKLHDVRWRKYSDIALQLRTGIISIEVAVVRISQIQTQSPADILETMP